MARPRSAARRRTSSGLISLEIRSFSKISTPSNPARLIAVSLSASEPLSDTVAMDLRMSRYASRPWTRL
jgi:hypothetical protein